MTSFPVMSAALSGYRLLLSRPATAAWWLAFNLVVAVFTTWATVLLAGPQLAALAEIQEGGAAAADPTTMMIISRQLAAFQLFSFVFPVLTNAVAFGAVNRAVLRPAEQRGGYLRFGADELRLIVTLLVSSLILTLAGVIAIAIIGIAALATGIPAAMREGPEALSAGGLAALALAAAAGTALVVFTAVKFSLAPAQTVADQGIRIFGSWGLTKGRFWRIAATFALAAVPVLLLSIVILAVILGLTPRGASGDITQILRHLQPDFGSMASAFSPRNLVGLLLQALVGAVAMAALIAPGAVIHAALTRPQDDEE